MHQERLPVNKWKVRYVVVFEPINELNTIVRVFRDVYIARCFKSRGGCSEYIRGTSVGHNEAWILNYVEKRIREGV